MSNTHYQVSCKIEKALNKMLKCTVAVISTDRLADLISSSTDCIVLDSRELTEFEVSHLPNAKWVGYVDFTLSRVADVPKDSNIVVYCSIGVRSENIAEKLLSFGFTNVWNLYGGIFAWANEHKTLARQNLVPTLSVHGYDQNWSKLVIHPYCDW